MTDIAPEPESPPTPPPMPEAIVPSAEPEQPPEPKGLIDLRVPDQIGNTYVVHAYPDAPFGLIDTIKNFRADAPPIEQVESVNAVLNMAFPPNESEMLHNLVRSPGGPSMEQMMGVLADLMERWFGRPTGGSTGSSNSAGPTNSSSAVASPSPEATPPALPPKIG